MTVPLSAAEFLLTLEPTLGKTIPCQPKKSIPHKQEGLKRTHRSRTEFGAGPTCQRRQAPKTATWSLITSRILRMQHAAAPPPTENHELRTEFCRRSTSAAARRKPRLGRRSTGSSISMHQLRDLPKPTGGSSIAAPKTARRWNSQDGPRASASSVDHEHISEDAPRASTATRRNPREGRLSRTESRGRSKRQRHDPPKTTKGRSIAKRNEESSQDAPRASAINDRKPREVVTLANSEHAPRASAGTRRKLREGSQCAFKIRTAPQRERYSTTCTHTPQRVRRMML